MVWAEVRLTPEGPGMFTNVPSCGRGVGPGTAPLKNSPVALLIGEGMTVEKVTAALWSIPAEPRPKSAKPRAVGGEHEAGPLEHRHGGEGLHPVHRGRAHAGDLQRRRERHPAAAVDRRLADQGRRVPLLAGGDVNGVELHRVHTRLVIDQG